MPITAAASVGLALLFGWLRLAAAIPPEGATGLYLPAVLYNLLGLPTAVAALLATLVMAFLWIPRAIIREAGYVLNGLATGGALLAALALIWSAWPLATSSIYRELESAGLGGRTIRLGLRLAANGDNICILCDCGRAALECDCRHITDPALRELSAIPRLAVDEKNRSVTVLMDERIIFEFEK